MVCEDRVFPSSLDLFSGHDHADRPQNRLKLYIKDVLFVADVESDAVPSGARGF